MYTKEDLQAQIHSIIEKYMPMTYRIAIQNVRSVEAAEDISQDVFIKLLETDTEFNDSDHIKAWLITVTVNLCRDYYRRIKKIRANPLTVCLLRPGKRKTMSIWIL